MFIVNIHEVEIEGAEAICGTYFKPTAIGMVQLSWNNYISKYRIQKLDNMLYLP